MSNNEASTSDASDNEAQGLGLGNGSTKTDTTQLNSEGNDSAHGAVEMSALMANAKAEPAEEKSPGTEAKKMKQKSAKETTREEEDENEDHEGEPSKCRSRIKLFIDLLLPAICIGIIVMAGGEQPSSVIIPAADVNDCRAPLALSSCFDPAVVSQEVVLLRCGDDAVAASDAYWGAVNATLACAQAGSSAGGVWVNRSDGSLVRNLAVPLQLSSLHCLNDPASAASRLEELQAPLPLSTKTLLALIPFVLVFQGILSFKLSSRYVAPFTLFVVILLGLNFFRDAAYFRGDPLAEAAGKVLLTVLDRGVWTVFEYALSVFSALFLLSVLQLWGVVDSMKNEFTQLAPTPTRKVVLVAFCFAIALAVVAPGGSNFVIAGSILISMNLLGLPAGHKDRMTSNQKIGALALFGNALTSAFNLLGVCIVTIAEDIAPIAFDEGEKQDVKQAAKDIGTAFSLQFLPFALLAPLIMAFLFSPAVGCGNKIVALKKDIFVCLSIGFVYAMLQLVVAWSMGPQLPCLLAGGGSLAFYLIVEHAGKGISCPTCEGIRKRAYILPFALLVMLLLIIGVVPGVEEGLKGGEDQASVASYLLNPYVLLVDSGGIAFKRRFNWLSDSAVIVFFIGVLTPFMVPYHATSNEVMAAKGGVENAFAESREQTPRTFRRAAKQMLGRLKAVTAFKAAQPTRGQRARRVLHTALSSSISDVLPVIVSITSFASIAKLMGRFEMTQSIAEAAVSGLADAPAVYALVAPVIGMMGSALTGSTTTSNFLFGRLQVNTAKSLGLTASTSPFDVAGIQILGATAGEIISPMNAVVITLMDGVNAKESDLISRLLPLAFVWLLGTMLMSFVMLVVIPGM